MLALADDPRPYGCKKLSGEDAYRIRVGDYRIVYSIYDDIVTVEVIRINHRKEVYKKKKQRFQIELKVCCSFFYGTYYNSQKKQNKYKKQKISDQWLVTCHLSLEDANGTRIT